MKNPIPKTQREILISQQTPYIESNGNPNNIVQNRSNELTFKGDDVKPFSLGLMDIDEAVAFYFKTIIKPHVLQNGNSIDVPIIYGSPEKWKSFQKDGYYRDVNNKMLYPLISFKRNSIEKDRTAGNKISANHPYNYTISQKNYSKNNTYDNFSILTNKPKLKTYYASVIPDYLIINYTGVIFTYYVEHMNKLIEAIEYASDSYWGDKENFQFQTKIDTFNDVVDISDDKDRAVSCTFNFKLRGYIVPELLQKDLNSIKKFNSKQPIITITEK